jgi:ATP-dependent DNA ligase
MSRAAAIQMVRARCCLKLARRKQKNNFSCRPVPWQTLPIAGFALKENRFDGLYIGRQKGSELIYAGKVDHGFDNASAKDLQARLKPLIRKTQPYSQRIGPSRRLG